MSIILEVPYFNSYVLKKISDVPFEDLVDDSITSLDSNANGDGWDSPQGHDVDQDWYIEESRIRGGYNNTSTDYGVKASIVEEDNSQSRLSNSLIYSGALNSRTGINKTNEFSVAQEITRSLDPVNGSIQKLYAEDTNLIIFQERKVSRALIDKDAIYSAEGSSITTTANVVIGQIVPYAGEYGISTNPQSFAVYGYQKYFTDRNRNAVLRLSMDGITDISNYGMIDFFRDKLSKVSSTGKIVGVYDVYNKNYTVSLQCVNSDGSDGEDYTLSFDESINGWNSFYTYKPELMFSSQGKFYSTNSGSVYEHYSQEVNRCQFYGVDNSSLIKFVFNPNPTSIKTFRTINYEGSNGWEVQSLVSDETGSDQLNNVWSNNQNIAADNNSKIYSYDEGAYVDGNIKYRAGFDRKQNKYVAAIKDNSPTPLAGQVLTSISTSGLKAYYATVTMKTDQTTDPGELKELFAVGSTYGR